MVCECSTFLGMFGVSVTTKPIQIIPPPTTTTTTTIATTMVYTVPTTRAQYISSKFTTFPNVTSKFVNYGD